VLIVWTAAQAEQLRRTIGATLKAMRPDVPEHRFEPFEPGKLVTPGKGDICLVCGSKPLAALQEAKLMPKGRTLNSLREKPLKPKAEGGFYMTTYDPGIVSSEPDKKALIDWDIRLANRLLTTGSLVPPVGDYHWVGSFAPLIARIETKHAATGMPVDVSCDTETEGLYPWYPDKNIVSIGFTDEIGTADLLYVGPQPDPVPVPPGTDLLGQVRWLLTSPKVKLRGANLKFDLIWIREKWGIECANFKFDTMLVGSLLDENRNRGKTPGEGLVRRADLGSGRGRRGGGRPGRR